jgi:peptidoglycan/xylan/chitin deacetylase (PgdA/CDA1 family)
MDKADFGRRGFDLMFFSGAASALSPICRGLGAIVQIHNVRPGGIGRRCFNPTSGLVITPGFLDAALAHLRQRGFDLVSLAEAVSRLQHRNGAGRPFITFTVDGAHRDSLIHAWPVFRKHNCPFTLFVATAVADGSGEQWWRGLEAVIAGETRISLEFMGISAEMPAITDAQKQAVWRKIYGPLRSMNPTRQRTLIRQLCSERGIDLDAICRAEAMNWQEIRTVSSDALCTLGAQTVHHFSLAGLSAEDAKAEMVESARRIERELGKRPLYLAYPYGDQSAAGPREFALAAKSGFAAAVTARRGMIFAEHRHHLLSLPRIALNGHYQELRYLDVLLSGVPSILSNGLRKLRPLRSSAGTARTRVRTQ